MGVEVRLTSHIAQYEQRVRGRLAEVTAEAARYCVTAAQIDCPVDTGALQASIHAEQQGPMTFTIIAGGVALFAGHGNLKEIAAAENDKEPEKAPAEAMSGE